MNLPELKGFSIDAWYKVFVYAGAALFGVSLFFEVKGISNSQLQLFSAAIFFIGLGEWTNHQKQHAIKPPNAYTGPTALLTRIVWKPTFVGIVFDSLGLVLIGIGIWSVLRTP